MRNIVTFAFVGLLAIAGGCNQNQKSAAANDHSAAPEVQQSAVANELSPEQLGELGAQIKKTPDRADQLLAHHGLTPKSFEAQIRKVTESPDESKRYAAAYRKAGA